MLLPNNDAVTAALEKLACELLVQPELNGGLKKLLEWGVVETDSTLGCLLNLTDENEITSLIYDPYDSLPKEGNAEAGIKEFSRTIFTAIEQGKWDDSTFILTQQNLPPAFATSVVSIEPCTINAQTRGILITARDAGEYNDTERSRIRLLARWAALFHIIAKGKTEHLQLVSKMKLQQQMESTATFADGIAHDINNLLSGMFGGIELLRMKMREPELERLLEVIQSSAMKVRDLSKGLLDRNKKKKKYFKTIAASDLLTEIDNYCKHSFPGEIEFLCRQEPHLFSVFGDYTQLYQVLMNLVVNAREAISSNGFIYVNARNTLINSYNKTEYPLLNAGEYIHFTVQDNGCGIQPDYLNKIFEPYFSTKSKKGGTGLGLSNVFSIVRAHGGIIEVDSVVGRGTRFDLYLPAIQHQLSQAEQTFPIIVLIDDDIALQELLVELLESQGYQVSNFLNPAEALQFLTEEIVPSLIITDYHLPEMSGIELIMKLREQGNHVPVILTSGDTAIENGIIDLSSINVEVLEKPFEFEALLSLADGLLRRSR